MASETGETTQRSVDATKVDAPLYSSAPVRETFDCISCRGAEARRKTAQHAKKSNVSSPVRTRVDRDPTDEVGFDGAEVILTGRDSLWRFINRSAITQNNGQFNFGPLWPGAYSVRVVPPQKYENSALLGIPGTIDGTTTGMGVINRVRFIVLREGQDGIDYLLPLEPTPD